LNGNDGWINLAHMAKSKPLGGKIMKNQQFAFALLCKRCGLRFWGLGQLSKPISEQLELE